MRIEISKTAAEFIQQWKKGTGQNATQVVDQIIFHYLTTINKLPKRGPYKKGPAPF